VSASSEIDSLQRLRWLRRFLLAGLLAGLLLSPRLWLCNRGFPLCPVIPHLAALPAPVDVILYVTLLLLTAAGIFLPRPGVGLALLVSLLALLCLGDQMRLQPWVYQYAFMTATLAGFYLGDDKPDRAERTLNVCRLIVASIYFWSGISKLNVTFPTGGLPFFLTTFLPPLPTTVNVVLGLTAGVVETGIGIGLLFPRVRQAAIYAALGMHLFILLCLGPLGRNFNSVIWPWNVAMALFVVILFGRERDVNWKAVLWPGKRVWPAIVGLLLVVLPALHIFDCWDAYLSADLYSGTVRYGHILFPASARERMPAEAQSHLHPVEKGLRVDLFGWATSELNVPIYPEARVYRAIFGDLCHRADSPADAVLVIQERPDLFTGERRLTFLTCAPHE
jgi:hypothetical protein